jgi:hypothetical protein
MTRGTLALILGIHPDDIPSPSDLAAEDRDSNNTWTGCCAGGACETHGDGAA